MPLFLRLFCVTSTPECVETREEPGRSQIFFRDITSSAAEQEMLQSALIFLGWQLKISCLPSRSMIYVSGGFHAPAPQ